MKLPEISDINRATILFLLLMTYMTFHPEKLIEDMAFTMFGVIVGALKAHGD